MVVPDQDAIARMETRILVLGDRRPLAIVEFDAEAPGITGSGSRIVFLDRVADRGTADHAGRCRCSAPAAMSELVAYRATDDGAEQRPSAAGAVPDFDLVHIAHRAAEAAVSFVRRRRAVGIGVSAVWRRRTIGVGICAVISSIRLVINDAMTRRRFDAGGQAYRHRHQNRDESANAQHDVFLADETLGIQRTKALYADKSTGHT